MIRPLGEVLKTIGGYGFHIYDDGGARWSEGAYWGHVCDSAWLEGVGRQHLSDTLRPNLSDCAIPKGRPFYHRLDARC
jgi:hypothetical protein